MQELLQLIFMVIGIVVTVLFVISAVIAWFNRGHPKASTLVMVRFHHYDAFGCKIDGGYKFFVDDDYDFEKRVQTYIDKGFKANTKVCWKVSGVEDK